MADTPSQEDRKADWSTIGESGLRGLMNVFPSGVSVLTTCEADGTPWGLTCTSICSVSLRPPILLACLHNASGTLAALLTRRSFAINLLHTAGQGAAEAFASADGDHFADVEWQRTPASGLPWLVADAHAVAECRVVEAVEAGDHNIVLGEVDSVVTIPKRPLLYGFGQYSAWSTWSETNGHVLTQP